MDAYEIAYRAHFLVGPKVHVVRPDHADHDFEDCPAWPKSDEQEQDE